MLSPLKRVLFPHDLSSSLLDSSFMSSSSATAAPSNNSRRSKKEKNKTMMTNGGGNNKDQATTTTTATAVQTKTTQHNNNKKRNVSGRSLSSASASSSLTGGGLTALVAKATTKTSSSSSTRPQAQEVQGNSNLKRKRSRSSNNNNNNSKSKAGGGTAKTTTTTTTSKSSDNTSSSLTALFLQQQQHSTDCSQTTSSLSPVKKKRRSKRQRDNRNMARMGKLNEASKKNNNNDNTSQGLSALWMTTTTTTTKSATTSTSSKKPSDLAVLDFLNSSLESESSSNDENRHHRQTKPVEKKTRQIKQTQRTSSNGTNVPSVLALSLESTKTSRKTKSSHQQRTKQSRRPLTNVTDSLGMLGGTINTSTLEPTSTTKPKKFRTTTTTTTKVDVTDSLGSFGDNESNHTRNYKKNQSCTKTTTTKTTTGRRNQRQMGSNRNKQQGQQSREISSSVVESSTSDMAPNNKSVGNTLNNSSNEEKKQSCNSNKDSSISSSTVLGNDVSDEKFDESNHITEADAGIVQEKNSTENDEKDRRIRELEAQLEEARRLMMEQKSKTEEMNKNENFVPAQATHLDINESSTSCASHSTLTIVEKSNRSKKQDPSPKRPVLQRRRSKRLSNSRKMDPPGICQMKESEVDKSIDAKCDDEIDMPQSGLQSEESEEVETQIVRGEMSSIPRHDPHVTEQIPFPSTLESPSPIKESKDDSSLVSATRDSTPKRRQKQNSVLRKSVSSMASPQNAEEFLDIVEDQNVEYEYESLLPSSTLNHTDSTGSLHLLLSQQKSTEIDQKSEIEEIHEPKPQPKDDSSKNMSGEIHPSSGKDGSTEKIDTFCESKEIARNPDEEQNKESRPRRKRVQPKRLVDEAAANCCEIESVEAKKKPNTGKTRGRRKKGPKEKSTNETPQNACLNVGGSPNNTSIDTRQSRSRTRSKSSQSLDVDTFVGDVLAGIDVECFVGALNRELSSNETRKNRNEDGLEGEICDTTPIIDEENSKPKSSNTESGKDLCGAEEDDIFDATPMRCEVKGKSSSMNTESNDPDEDEDDIFDATPMRYDGEAEIKKCERISNICEGSTDEDDIFASSPLQQNFINKLEHERDSKGSSRKGRRQRTRPDRFGEYADRAHDSPDDAKISKSAKKQKKGPAISKKNKKRVRISSEGQKKDDEEKLNNSPAGTFEGDWSSDDLEMLRMAHKRVNPQSICFWDDVSDQLDGKWTATECRDKWFSLVKTPIIGRKTKRNRVDQDSEGHEDPQRHMESIAVADDDIFNATPMKNVVANLEDDRNLKGISNMELKGSAIKVKDRSAVMKSQDGDKTSYGVDIEEDEGSKQIVCRGPPQGYKTYLQSMRRTMKRELKAKKKKKASKFSSLKLGKNLSEWADEGDVEMNCRLSPGGTLQIQKSGHDSDNDDMWDEDEEEI